jgi:signal transduction histidine kinase
MQHSTKERNDIISTAMMQVRQAISRWWGGIGFRVSFLMTLALVLVAALVGAFFFWEGKKSLDAEIRGRELFLARELAAAASNDILANNRSKLYKTLLSHFTVDEDALSDSAVLYLMVYDKNCNLLAGITAAEVKHTRNSVLHARQFGNAAGGAFLRCETGQIQGPVFLVQKNGIYDLTLPVTVENKHTGFIRVGMSGQRYGQQFSSIMKKAGAALLGILLVGLAFSRIIALSITKPVLRLSEAVGKLSRQNWDTPLPVKGSDEISTLSHAFNQMALALKQREASLSHGNRDLFILHTAGLDLMESLDRDSLLAKIAARVEDLVRADTTAISVVVRTDRMLTYLGVFGNMSRVLKERELPIEAGGIYNWLASYGTPLLIPDAQADFRLDSEQMKSLGIKSIIAVPLWSSNAMLGLLTAINKKGDQSFDRHDLRLLTVFSSLAAAALQNASLYSDLKGKMIELKATQEQLVHSTKMAAIGELSTNVAHEINNPLTSVLGYTTHLLKTLPLPEASRQTLKMMEQETLRVRKIIRNLLDFARHKPSWKQPADIALPLRETVALLQGIADSASVAILEEYPPSPIMVNIDHNEMKQVFINIVNNALHAMPQGGTLRIRLDRMQDKELVVKISDTGHGIPPEHVGKIFEPFYSTKGSGDGTGLGLSISYRIVRNHGGRIEVESKVGVGSTFSVFLPI